MFKPYMVSLTRIDTGDSLLLNPAHVVSVEKDNQTGGSLIYMQAIARYVDGGLSSLVYHVRETQEEITQINTAAFEAAGGHVIALQERMVKAIENQ